MKTNICTFYLISDLRSLGGEGRGEGVTNFKSISKFTGRPLPLTLTLSPKGAREPEAASFNRASGLNKT